MKMAYEQPKMSVEFFAPENYFAACDSMHTFTGWVVVNQEGEEYRFWGEGRIETLNQFTGQRQYYYKEADDSSIYLEYSAHHDAFILYQEGGSTTGYYENVGSSRNPRYEQIFNGGSSLQTNVGAGPTFAAGMNMQTRGQNGSGTNFLDANGNTVHADAWMPDICLGKADPTQEVVITNS